MEPETSAPNFDELGLSSEICQTVKALGYEIPTPIQREAIPVILSGKDLIGQAHTGTGKTAAFALPLLSRIKGGSSGPQVLVLTPTRELAIQVSEAFRSYAHDRKGFKVVSIYGGQSIMPQLKQLDRKPQVVVGTPGRILDHLRRGSLDLSVLEALVLDEADEMLSMGFFEDIEAIIQQTPETRQTVLFSATMPKAIRSIAERYLREPSHVVIERLASDPGLIQQSYWLAEGMHKLDAVTRILEANDTDGTLIFVRTKTATVELAEQLEGRGYAATALSGDLTQEARERAVKRLKDRTLDIIVATDVAARGLDVERINYVINYDIPFDAETYTHRIGRTGRAGRMGRAILFVSPRERGLLRTIERGTGRPIEPYPMPSRADVNARRLERLQSKLESAIKDSDLAPFQRIVESLLANTGAEPAVAAAALCAILHKETPLFIEKDASKPAKERRSYADEDRPRFAKGARRELEDGGRKLTKRDRFARYGEAPNRAEPRVREARYPKYGKQEGSAAYSKRFAEYGPQGPGSEEKLHFAKDRLHGATARPGEYSKDKRQKRFSEREASSAKIDHFLNGKEPSGKKPFSKKGNSEKKESFENKPQSGRSFGKFSKAHTKAKSWGKKGKYRPNPGEPRV